MKRNSLYAILCVTVFLCASINAFSGVVSVKNIVFTFPAAQYFTSTGPDAGYFAFDMMGTGQLQTSNSPTSVYDYTIEDAQLMVSQSQMYDDLSAGTKAKAEFYGGGILTLEGVLKYGSDVVYDGVLFEMEMKILASELWTLSETELIPNTLGSLEASLVFDPTASAVGFNSGIAHNGDTLMIGQSSVGYQFQTIAGVSDFQSDITTLVPTVQIASAIVPEPATMVLLSLGSIIALKRKK